MEKLVYVHSWGDIGCSGTSHIAFEYESKDKFLFDTFEKFKSHEWEVFNEGTEWESHGKVELFPGVYIDKFEFESLEHNLYTLEKWFDREKVTIK